MLEVFKKGFNYSQDGAGNRLVYHLQNCNMKCPWCSNPEGMNKVNHLNSNNGLESYERRSIDDIVNEVKRSKMLFFDGGGVTLSGGEPTLQFDKIKELLVKLKNNGINTAIETNGTNKNLQELFSLIDILIIDYKHYDHNQHLKITGVSNTIIKENIIRAFENHKNVLIRTPLINDFNASEEDLKKFIEFYKLCDTTNAKFEFLPYHEFGKVKWKKCKLNYNVQNGFVTQERVALFEDTFRKNGMTIIRT